jgi:phage-related protein
MIPAYQTNELNYDNRIKRKINTILKKKYTNTELVTFQGRNDEADELYIQIEKILYLIYSLLQESHTYLFSMGLGSMDANHNTTAQMPETPAKRGRPEKFATTEHIQTALSTNTHSTAKAIGSVASFKSQMGQILKMGNTLQSCVKKITTIFDYLNEQQVQSIEELCDNITEMLDQTFTFLQNELANLLQIGGDQKEIDASTNMIQKVASDIINPNIEILLQLVAGYNPITAPIEQPTVNTNSSGDGYTLDNGHFHGHYV